MPSFVYKPPSKEDLARKELKKIKSVTMNYLIILLLVAMTTADRLEKTYLPPNAQSSAGGNAGLQTPRAGNPGAQGFRGQGIQGFGSGGLKPQGFSGSPNAQGQGKGQGQAEILKFENEMTAEGYHYAYESSDGTKAEQQGRNIPGSKPEEGSLQVQGSYSYIGDDGQTYSITYTADENGYRAEGAHLPTPPPIPEAILKSLQLTGGGAQNNYNSPKSSYDADAGYHY